MIGFTSKLSVNDGTSNADTVLAEVVNITWPSLDTEAIENTHMGLTDPFKTYTPGLTDAGTIQFECNYSSATYTRLYALLGKLKHDQRIPATGTAVTWKISAPDEDGSGSGTAQSFSFNGMLSKLDMSADNNTNMVIKGEIKISGKPTIA